MKKILITFFLIPITCFSQAINGDITYKVSYPVNEEINKTPDLKNIFEEIRDGLQMLEMKLYFTNKESEFTVVEYNGLDKDKWELSRGITMRNYPIYADKNSVLFNTIQKNNNMFKDYEYLVSNTFGNWSLENETKMIDNFKCFKAIKKEENKVEGQDRIITRTITAWYCPEIPVSFGPNGYGGLPGVILELNENNLKIFYATKIDLSVKNVIISKPYKGKPIHQKEYSKIASERINNSVMGRG